MPGVIVTENITGETRYLLSDGLGSVRHATAETGAVVSYNEFDPYGNTLVDTDTTYAFTGEWWESEVGLLHLRARWYSPEMGTFLSRDAVESEPPYQYVRGNVVNWVDPSGFYGEPISPSRDEWINANGAKGSGIRAELANPPASHDFAMQKIVQNRDQIIRAAERHKFFGEGVTLCDAPTDGLQKLYMLAGIIYQESVGWYKEMNGLNDYGQADDWYKHSSVQVALNDNPWRGTSIGIAQVNYYTALEAENAGLVYDPYKSRPGYPVEATM